MYRRFDRYLLPGGCRGFRPCLLDGPRSAFEGGALGAHTGVACCSQLRFHRDALNAEFIQPGERCTVKSVNDRRSGQRRRPGPADRVNAVGQTAGDFCWVLASGQPLHKCPGGLLADRLRDPLKFAVVARVDKLELLAMWRQSSTARSIARVNELELVAVNRAVDNRLDIGVRDVQPDAPRLPVGVCEAALIARSDELVLIRTDGLKDLGIHLALQPGVKRLDLSVSTAWELRGEWIRLGAQKTVVTKTEDITGPDAVTYFSVDRAEPATEFLGIAPP